MNNLPLASLFSCMILGFASGGGTAWYFHEIEHEVPVVAERSAVSRMNPDFSQNGMQQPAWHWGQTDSPDGARTVEARIQHLSRANTPTAEQKLRDAALEDPTALQKLVATYESESDPKEKQRLKAILASIDAPEVTALSTRLAASSDAAQRREGLEMLQHAPATAEVRNIVRQTLATEQSADIIVPALAALKPAAVASTEANNIVGQLQDLTRHADPVVRSHSILQLAQWDRRGSASAHLQAALADPMPEVREAAINAMTQAGVRNEHMKAALLEVITRPSETDEMKSLALHALQQFSLHAGDYAIYVRAKAQLAP